MPIVHIEVTQDDIDSGIKCDHIRCPIGIAIERDTGRVASVCGDKIRFRLESSAGPYHWYHWVGVDTPEVANDFIGTFDTEARVHSKPFSFDIEVPEGVL
jgi:hypothetical protein